mmetsp:Transcript_18033/g.43197  ORF Transcript_18033/g.43197 Transcript_18033/m.43197 type:complete len:87 (+) Transcript_18033:886-1146(+)
MSRATEAMELRSRRARVRAGIFQESLRHRAIAMGAVKRVRKAKASIWQLMNTASPRPQRLLSQGQADLLVALRICQGAGFRRTSEG